MDERGWSDALYAPFGLIVDGRTQQGYTPKMEVDAIIKNHRQDNTKIRSVTGVGEIATFFTFNDGISELVGASGLAPDPHGDL
jgi:hypothetical protein